MSYNQDQLLEAWKLRVHIYALRTPKKVFETYFIPFIFLLMPLVGADFDRQVVISCALSYSFYLLLTTIVNRWVSGIKKRRYRKGFSYHLTAILNNIHELAILAMIFAGSLAGGIYFLQTITSIFVIRILLLCLVVFVIALVLISPKILRYRSLDRPNKLDKYLPQALAITGVLSALGVLISVLLSSSDSVDSRYYFLMILEFSISILLLPILIWNYHDIIVIGLRKWPEIKRSGSTFSIQFP